jgi:tape measure domain-containing protein
MEGGEICMSTSIDERVVSMKFDNAQFSKASSDTIKQLGDLEKGLKLDGATRGLQSIADAASKISLERLALAADTIQSRFSGMSVVVTGILLSLGGAVTNFAINAAKSLGTNLIASAKEGFGEYETQINAVQTILSNTASKGTTIDQVNAALLTLNKYADDTIYNFSEMAKNIGTFTAAGVDLDTSTAAIKGIANLAAMSGSNSQQASTAMYQLSQALSAGKVSLMDWNSVVNAGMGGQVFQDALKETARNHGIAVDDIIAKNGSFRDSLQDGWITSAVLTDTLAKFTGDLTKEQIISMGYTEQQADEIIKLGTNASDAATKIKTFSQLMGSLKESVSSGWAQSWQIILGDFEEAKVLFTEVSDRVGAIISASTDARNAQLQIWKDLGGRTAMIDAIRNAFDAVMQIVTPIGQAFRDVFPPSWGTTLAKISFALRDFTAGLKIGEQGSKNLYNTFKFLFTGLKFFTDLAGGALRIFFDNIKVGFQFIQGIVGLATPFITFLANLMGGVKGVDLSISGMVDGFIAMRKEIVGPVLEALSLAGTALNELLNGDPSKFSDMWSNAMKPLVKLGEDLKEKYANVIDFLETRFSPVGDRIAKNWSGVLAVVQAVMGFFKKVGQVIGQLFSELGGGFAELFEGADFDTVLAALNTGLLVGVVLAVRNAFKSITSIFDAAGSIGDGISGALEGLTGVLKGMAMDLKAEALLKIAGAIGILALSLLVLSMIDPGQMQQAAITLGIIAGAILGILVVVERIMSKSNEMSSWSDTLKGSFTSIGDSIKNNLNASALIKAAIALGIMAGAIILMAVAMGMIGSMAPETIIKGLIGITVAMGLLVGAAKIMEKFEGAILKSAFAMVVMAGAITALAGAVAIFGNMPIDVLIQGGIAVAITLAALVGAAVLISKFASQMVMSAVGLMAMAAALNMLVLPLTALGLLPMPFLIQGIAAIGIVLAILVIAAQALSALGPKMAIAAVGLMAMAAAVGQLVIPITALGSLDMATLIQGLIAVAAVLAILVVAANAMTGAITGAGAMIVVAGALLILSGAILILGSMPLGNLIQGLVGMAAAFAIIGLAALLLTPVMPQMLMLAAAIALVGVGLVLMSGAVLIFSLAIMMLGPALMSVSGGLLVFADTATKVVAAVPAMLALGVGLIAFGAGALVAGAGILVLGIGLIALGAGLALVGAVGLIGAVALAAVIKSMSKLTEHIPAMLMLTPTFLALGAAVLVLGAGLAVLGAGALLTGLALMMLVPLGGLVTVAFAMIMKAIDKANAKAGETQELGTTMGKLGTNIQKVGTSGSAAASGLNATSSSFTSLNTTATTAATGVKTLSTAVTAMVPPVVMSTTLVSTSFKTMSTTVLQSTAQMVVGFSSYVPIMAASSTAMGRAAGQNLVREVQNQVGPAGNAGYQIGTAVTQGMRNGIQNGSYLVSAAARSVALQALASSKAALGVHSPSREYFKVGDFMDQGLADGQIRNVKTVTNASKYVAEASIKQMKKSLSNVANAITGDMEVAPTIRPVLDLSGVKQGASTLGSMFGAPKLRLDNNFALAQSAQATIEPDDDDDDEPMDLQERVTQVTFIQNNTSPKALSASELNRSTRNQIARAKEELAKKP